MTPKFRLILFSPPNNVPNEIAQLCQIFEENLWAFHLRKPQFSLAQMQHYLAQIPQQYYPKIVVHAHYCLLEKYALKGIHLSENDRNNAQNLANYPVVSTSFHSFETWKALQNGYQYVFLSPVFNSISKQNYPSQFTPTDLQSQLLQHKNTPTIALGGIDAHNIVTTQNWGFDGAATIGTVWQSAQPVAAFRQLQAKLR